MKCNNCRYFIRKSKLAVWGNCVKTGYKLAFWQDCLLEKAKKK